MGPKAPCNSGDIPLPLHCNWSVVGTRRAARAAPKPPGDPEWSQFTGLSHPPQTRLLDLCTHTWEEHTLSICSTPWPRSPCCNKGGQHGLTGPFYTRRDASKEWGKNAFYFPTLNSFNQLNSRGQRWLWSDSATLIWTIRFQVAAAPQAMWPCFLCASHN